LAASSDADPLIWLAKCSALHLLRKLYTEIEIPEAVRQVAVTRGLEKGYEDAKAIQQATEEEWIRVHETSKQFTDRVESTERRLHIELGAGERQAIALALERDTSTFLTNDEDAYQIGKTLGLETRGVLHMLLRGVKEKHQSKEQAKETLRKMLEEGLWLSPAIIHGFHEALARL
jgi:predicted nucleic acid-binding protein